MARLTQILNNFVRTAELDEEDWVHVERFILLSKEGGISRQKSLYMLCPAEFVSFLNDKFAFDIAGDNVDRNCRLAVEKDGDGPLQVRVLYEFRRRRGY